MVHLKGIVFPREKGVSAVNTLEHILATKRREVAEREKWLPLSVLESWLSEVPPPRPFTQKIRRGHSERVRLIAELKKASPSRGLFRSDFDPAQILRAYDRSPATAFSILTDKPFFKGSLALLPLARRLTKKPLLRKDFLIAPYQIFEARVYGADAVLLIVAALTPRQLSELLALSRQLGMDALVETHTEEELEMALTVGAECLGINNRDLKTFRVDLTTTFRLMRLIPKGRIVVSESGIETREQVKMLEDAGVDAILVGESLIRSPDPVAKARELLGL